MGPLNYAMGLEARDARWEQAIDRVDPLAGAHVIFGILFDRIFPLDLLLASELGQLRTFAVPSISRLLAATGQYVHEGQKRVDDTRAILAEIMMPGPTSARGGEMIAHLNRIHGHYTIANDDYLLTLAALAVSPIEHVDVWGHRPMRPHERAAWYAVFRQLGERMGLTNIPPTYEAMVAFRSRYEAAAVRYDPANVEVARAVLRVLADALPAPLQRIVEPTVALLLGAPHVVAALGLRAPTSAERRLIEATLRARAAFERRYTAYQSVGFSKTPLFTELPTYPEGYARHLLGPRKIIARMLAADRQRGAAQP
jgi:hypothetical protein